MADLFETLRDALVERYAVERELGRGGMATVFLAEDLKHQRPVAIKVLHSELAAALGSDRFLREIEIAARLRHPHILPLYDSGSAGRFLYYVMPYVEGESLRDRLEREKQFSLEDALKITAEVASALAYAHSHGVVHRDIKPENIMLEGGTAVVADFGIARAVSAAGAGEHLTQTGTVIGTPMYMSPEQATGSGEIDGRSDQYSLACVLYEMLVGAPPFSGPSAQAIMARHSLDLVSPPSIVRTTIPDAVEDAILRALAKTPADRFPTTALFAEALQKPSAATGPMRRMTRPVPAPRRWLGMRSGVTLGVVGAVMVAAAWGSRSVWSRSARPAAGSAGGLDPRRIAVLYFEDLSRDTSLAYLTDGFTEALIDELAQVRTLDVISRNGVALYRGAKVSRDSLARALAAGTVVEGSVEPTGARGARVRVTVRLVDGASGAEIRRQAFELPTAEPLAMRDSLAHQASRFLRERLGEDIRLREERTGTASVEAWTLVQRGERLRKRADSLFRVDDVAGAVRALEQADSVLMAAEAADPRWTEPVLRRGAVARQRSRLAPPLQAAAWIDSGLAHATRAFALAPNEPRVLELRGTLRYAKWLQRVVAEPVAQRRLLQDARSDLESATQADPSLAAANLTLSHLLYQVDDVPGAMLRARQAYDEDAYLTSADWAVDRLFWGALDLEQFSEARRWCATGVQRFPNDPRFVSCELWLMVTPAVQSDVQRAWELSTKLERVTPAARRAFAKAEGLLLVGGALGRAGAADSARRVMLRARQLASHDIDPDQTLLAREAYVRTLVRDYDEAIDLLKRYVAANPGHEFLSQAGTVWWWRELRAQPRWRELSQAGR